MKYRYARISKIDQNADMPLKAVQQAGVEPNNIFKEQPLNAENAAPR